MCQPELFYVEFHVPPDLIINGRIYFFIVIGFGVLAKKSFKKGDFILEYVGERIDENEGKLGEHNGNCYVFAYRYNGRFQWYVNSVYKNQNSLGHNKIILRISSNFLQNLGPGGQILFFFIHFGGKCKKCK